MNRNLLSIISENIETHGFTVRQHDLTIFLLNGDTNKAIAKKLDVTEACVKYHLTSIFYKLNIKTRVDLVLWCINEAIE